MRWDHQFLVPLRKWEFAASETAPTTGQPVVGTAVVAVDLRVEVEGEPVVLEVPSLFLSAAPKSVAGAAGASEPAVVASVPAAATFGPAVVADVVAVEAIAR